MDIGKVGQALYADNWRAPLARALDVNERTIRRWEKGEFEVNPSIAPELIKLIDQKLESLTECKIMLNTAKLVKQITDAANDNGNASLAGRSEFFNGLTFSDEPYTTWVTVGDTEYLVIWETINPDDPDASNACDWESPSAIWDNSQSKYIA